MYTVTDAELDTVASLGNSIHLTFLGISFGTAIAFGIVLATVQVTDPLAHASFVALAWLSAFLTVYFAIRAFVDYRAAQRKLSEIKR